MSPLTELIGGAKAYGWGKLIETGPFESIATTTVGSGGTSTITFSSIPATFTHLQIRISSQTNRGTYGTDYALMRLNSDSAGNYSRHFVGGDGSTTLAGGTVNGTFIAGPATGTNTGSTFGGAIIDILDYANTNKYKTIRILNGNDLNGTVGGYGGEIYLLSGNWRDTSAVSSISFVPNSGTLFNQYSHFALYGIRSA